MTVLSGASRLGVATWASRLLGGRSVASLDDGALLTRAAQGDELACRELLERYGTRLLSVVETAHGDLGLGEDVVQEAFLRAIKKSDQLKDQQAFFPWLVRIALRVAIDFRRRRKEEALPDAFSEVAATDEPSPDARYSASEDAALVQRALSAMKPYPRELLTLRYFTHLSVAELAEVFDKSEAAIRKDLQRARAQMKKQLAPWFEENE